LMGEVRRKVYEVSEKVYLFSFPKDILNIEHLLRV
jgi:hypothetical protein